MRQQFWKVGFVLAWFLLIDPMWKMGGAPSPIARWQSFGSYPTQEICESHRTLIISEAGTSRLTDGSQCVSDGQSAPQPANQQ